MPQGQKKNIFHSKVMLMENLGEAIVKFVDMLIKTIQI